MPDLAVIMSIYHRDRLSFVKESVESILQQTFSDFHYYITFDGPVKPEVDEYVSSLKDDRIRLFRLEQNGGLAVALNYMLTTILKNPEYEYIARMDADDISLPSRFEKQWKFLLNNREISIIGCWYEKIDEWGKHFLYSRLPTEHDELRKRYFTRTPLAHPSVMFRRELIEKAGLYPTDTMHMEDNVLWGRALNKGLRMANISEILLLYRIDNQFFTRRFGFNYGWGYIKTRIYISQLLSLPIYLYFLIISIGLIKMMPPSVMRTFYNGRRFFLHIT